MPQDFTTGQVLTAAQMDTLSGAVDGYATTATAAGTTTLTTASLYQQFFTGSTTQTVTMPVASTLYVGQKFRIVNNSSGVVTVKSSGANTIYAVPASSDVIFTCILASGTTAASWDYKDYVAAAGAASGLTKVTSAAISAVSSVELQSIFTSTYKRYMVILSVEPTSNGATFSFQWMSGVNTVNSSANYYGPGNSINNSNTSTNWGYTADTKATISTISAFTGISDLYYLYFNSVGNSSQLPIYLGHGAGPGTVERMSGWLNQANTYTGIKLTVSAGTITGDYQVYGLAN